VNEQGPSFPEYGHGGDCAGARRVRRAFRLCVAGCLFFTGMLWLSEYFLRYDTTERLYLNALTHATESARVMLRSAVKIDAETRESPTPKYVAALAEREDGDQVLFTYDRAYKLDPNNSFLAIRYGCQLFFQGRFKDARERFREAGAQLPKNALPGYLEAAALQWEPPVSEDLADSLALVARTNSSGEEVVFPRPSWPGSILPQDGAWYAKLRREAVDECCAPLYRYADFVIARAREDIGRDQVQYWDSWLKTLQEMGERLMSSPDLGSIQAIAGIQVQLDALDQRTRICEMKTGVPKAELIERVVQLRTALKRLNAFERARDGRIASDRDVYVFPLMLCAVSTLALLACYLPVYALSKVVHVGRDAWTVRHTKVAKGTVIGGCGFLFALLCTVEVLQRLGALHGAWKEWVAYPWTAVLILMVAFGVIYPSLTLPSARKVVRAAGEVGDDEGLLRSVRKCRQVAGLSLMRRYYGILLGLFLCTVSMWVVIYRVFVSLYPWQVALLTTGLGQEEAALTREVLALLG